MKIAIIGTGNVGGTLAEKWAKAGHDIHLGVRDTENFKGQELLAHSNVIAQSIASAAQEAEVILVATPPQIVQELINSFGNIDDKIIIDATNVVAKSPESYPTAFHAFEALTKAEVVKCFNTTGYENMKNTEYGTMALDMFMAGNSTRAKAVAGQLAMEVGFENCYDFGDSDKVELLEKLALSWINLAISQGMGRNVGLKLVVR